MSQWSEILYGFESTKNPGSTVAKVCDFRNVYVKFQSEVLTIKGAEKKANIELLSLKEARKKTGVIVCWVHSEAQLGNSLIKKHGGKELELFYRMQRAWKTPLVRSARKRKVAGLESLFKSRKYLSRSPSQLSRGTGAGGHARCTDISVWLFPLEKSHELSAV